MSRNAEKAARFEKTLGGLFQRIHEFSVRETKQAADIQLPEKLLTNVAAELEPRQSEIYARFRREFAAIVVKDGIPEYDNAEEILKRLLRLIQVASNPKLIDDSYHAIPGKFPVLVNLVEEIVDRDEKAIIWTTFTENVDWLARELRGFSPVRVHGKLSYDERGRSIKSFKSEADPGDRFCLYRHLRGKHEHQVHLILYKFPQDAMFRRRVEVGPLHVVGDVLALDVAKFAHPGLEAGNRRGKRVQSAQDAHSSDPGLVFAAPVQEQAKAQRKK